MQATFATWNISRSTDFMGMYVRAKIRDWTQPKDLLPRREELFTLLFARIQPDILCLQEVENTEEVTRWLGKSYEVLGQTGDCLIAWKRDKFECSAEKPWSDKDGRGLSVKLVEKTSRKTLQVTSLHVPGFSLKNPTDQSKAEGKRFLETAIGAIEKCADTHLLGIDLNATPTIGSERLAFLQEHGFIRDDDNSPTAYNPDLQEHCAKIDYVFVKGAGLSLMQGPVKLALETPKQNPSDHCPLFRTITL